MKRSAARARRAWLVFGLAVALAPAAQARPVADSVVRASDNPGSEAEIVVSTTADVSNGDVSSPVALASNPGSDGISLREAILASNNTPGPHAIVFAPSLEGQTIDLSEQLPSLTRDYVSIDGHDDLSGEPAVTIDGDGVGSPGVTVNVIASHIGIRHLRFVRIRDNAMIAVAAGARADGSVAPQIVSDVVVEDNVFDQTGYVYGGSGVAAVTEEPALNATVRNVIFKGNRFINLTRVSDSAVAVSIATSGNHTTVEDVSVYDNEFTGTQLPIEVNSFLNSDNTISGTRIVRNTFTGSEDGNGGITMIMQGVPGQPTNSRNTISDTLVEGNLFAQNSGSFLSVYSGIDNAEDNLVSDLSIISNVLDGGQGLRFTGGTVADGSGGSASNNEIRGVHILNNTLNSSAFAIVPNFGVATGNSISDLQISNSIVWNTSHPDLTAYEVSYSLFCDFEGANGNLCADPLFVDGFHLQAGSPAIDAGTSDGGVPLTDMECRARVDDLSVANTGAGAYPYYDMGAYEYGASSATCTTPDTTPPETTISSGPDGAIDDTTATFGFYSSEAGSTFLCRIDAGADVSCSSTFTTPALTDGSHTFRVWAIDEAGNADTTAALRSFSVDTLPPETTIDSGPAAFSNDPTPTFTFSSSEAGSTFECGLDAGPFAACASPYTTTVLADGLHTFQVRATDSLGHVDTSPAPRSFTIDTVPPQTTITADPGGATGDTTPAFSFSSSEAGSAFYCRLDTGTDVPCSSPYTTPPLSDGSHTFHVRAVDEAGNADPTADLRSFSVDTVPPETAIDYGPLGPTKDSTPTLAFSASEAGSTFECGLDAGPFAACTSPYTTTALADGPHAFQVRALDSLGHVDASPALRSFTIDTVPPQTKIVRAPARKTRKHVAVFKLQTSERGSRFQCKLDKGRYKGCSAARTYKNLTHGSHTFTARAIDAVGNVDRSPVLHRWKITK